MLRDDFSERINRVIRGFAVYCYIHVGCVKENVYQTGDNRTVLQDATKKTQLYFGLAWNICIGVNGTENIRL